MTEGVVQLVVVVLAAVVVMRLVAWCSDEEAQ